MALLNGPISEEAQTALNRAVALHLYDPNVSLIDLGMRVRDSQGHRLQEELCVRVHVRRKLYAEAFDAFAARYPERVIDSKRVGFQVDVPVGDYRVQWWPWWSWYRSTPTGPRAHVFNPMQGGISISNALQFGYGTLGGKVVDRDTGAEMILSNWHVLVNSWSVRAGLPIYQPGQGDGGRAEHTVARLSRHAMDHFIDAAVAELTGTRPLLNEQLGLGPVTGVRQPVPGLRITKSGRRTGVTTGIITGIEGRQVMTYAGVQRVIRHVVHIAKAPDSAQVSAKGDSGAWWLEQDTRQAVGLHFAGSDLPEYGLAMAMSPVLDALNVDIATEIESVGMAPARRLEPAIM
jgi:hypothetical protein